MTDPTPTEFCDAAECNIGNRPEGAGERILREAGIASIDSDRGFSHEELDAEIGDSGDTVAHCVVRMVERARRSRSELDDNSFD